MLLFNNQYHEIPEWRNVVWEKVNVKKNNCKLPVKRSLISCDYQNILHSIYEKRAIKIWKTVIRYEEV